MDDHQNAIEIAVIKEQISGLREQHRNHAETTKKQFDALGGKVDELLAAFNRGKGAYAASIALAGLIGAVIIKGISAMASYISR